MVVPGAQRRIRTGRVVVALLALLLIVPSCGKRVIKIGFSGTLSGRTADLGVQGLNGVRLAVEEANAAGGIDGATIELIAVDDKADPETARRTGVLLAEAGVPVIIGHMTSAMTKAALEVSADRDILYVSPSSSSSFFSDRDDALVRVCATNRGDAQVPAEHLAMKGRPRVVAVFDKNNRSYSHDLVSAFNEIYTGLGGEVLAVLEYDGSTPGAAPALAESLRPFAPGALFLGVSGYDLAMIVQHLRNRGMRMPVYAGGWAMTDSLLKTGGRAVEGVMLAQFFDENDRSDSYLRFKSDYQKRYGYPPTFASVYGYDAAMVVIAALRNTGSADADEIKREILRIRDFRSVMGPLSINRYGDSIRRSLLFEVRSGSFVRVP